MDHVSPQTESTGKSGRSDLEQNVTRRSTWVRLIFMLVLAVIWGISRVVTAAVVVIQFFYVLLGGETNDQLKTLGHSLAIYSYEITDYLTFNSELKPFPFDSAWPTELPQDEFAESDDDL
jgi:hypothetical protein